MKQKLQDLKLLLLNDRKIWAAVGFIGVVLFLWMLTAGDGRNYGGPRGKVVQSNQQGSSQYEAYNDLIVAFQNDLEKLEGDSNKQEADINRLVNEFSAHREQVRGIFDTVVDKIEHLTNEVDKLASARATQDVGGELDGDGAIPDPDALTDFGFDTTDVPAPPAANQQARSSVISPGDSVKVKLLTGVNAPTDGTPYPVVFQLEGPVHGPDGSLLEVGEARLIAAAQGSISDGRALFRLTNLAVRHKDGRRSVVPVDGWIVGEDGVRGMKGRTIDKLGRLIAATAGVSFAAAIGERVTDRTDINIQNTGELEVNSGDFDYATASALTDASNRLGQLLIDRYESYVPVIEILSGREVAAVFSRVATIEEIDEEDYDYGIHSASLD